MREFMGLNVHTVQFKPALYAPVCRNLRDYHPLGWDLDGDPSRATKFPTAANGVDWDALYGAWAKAGFEVDACLMFDDIKPEKWNDPAATARAYGEAFARAFGPSGDRPWVRSAEVGNEPSKYTEAQYRAIFEAMANGLRAGDPKLLVATCAVMTGATDEWSKSLSSVAGLGACYDVLNLHSYAFKEKWPTWRRSYPEDPAIDFLKSVDSLLRWRDANARGKQFWLTEFGYDSASKPPPADGPWKQWVGLTDDEQARYLVRSFLVLSATGLDRAYLYFFNDDDQPQLHGASGLTRGFRPKPSFYAVSHLYRTLGDYRFARAVAREPGGVYCFEYDSASKPSEKIYVAWSANDVAAPAARRLTLGADASRVWKAEHMPRAAGEGPRAEWKAVGDDVEARVGGDPIFLFVR